MRRHIALSHSPSTPRTERNGLALAGAEHEILDDHGSRSQWANTLLCSHVGLSYVVQLPAVHGHRGAIVRPSRACRGRAHVFVLFVWKSGCVGPQEANQHRDSLAPHRAHREEFTRHGMDDVVTLTHRNVCKEGFTVVDTVDAGTRTMLCCPARPPSGVGG